MISIVGRRLLGAVVVLAAGVGIMSTYGEEGEKRVHVPDAAALQKAEKKVAEEFDVSTAKTPSAKVELAHTLSDMASKIEYDIAAKYVLYEQAADLAASAGNWQLVIAIIENMDRHFVLDAREKLKAHLLIAAKSLTKPDELKALDAALTLADNPNEPSANEILGRYFITASMERWERDSSRDPRDGWNEAVFDKGVAYLAKGKDPELKRIAEVDLKGRSDHFSFDRQDSETKKRILEQAVELGDTWNSLVEKQSGILRTACQLRAWRYYSWARDSVTGLAQHRAYRLGDLLWRDLDRQREEIRKREETARTLEAESAERKREADAEEVRRKEAAAAEEARRTKAAAAEEAKRKAEAVLDAALGQESQVTTSTSSRTSNGGHENLVKVGGGTESTEAAVQAGLRWLARHQDSDGGWSVQRFARNCGRYKFAGSCTPNRFTGGSNFDAGVSGLALLAFLGAGYTPSSHEKVFAGVPDSPTFGGVVKGALKHLLSIQTSDGRIGPQSEKYMYNHTICTLALCEAYGMTALPVLKDPTQRAVDYLVRAKSPGGGWRYVFQCGETDSCVTGWAIMALNAAEVADIKFDRSAYDDVRKYYSGVTDWVNYDKLWTKPKSLPAIPVDLRLWVTGYKSKDDAGSLVALQGVNEPYDYAPALTAIMIMSRVLIDHKITTLDEAAIDTLLAYLPQKWSPDDQGSWYLADFYYWYHGTSALRLALAPDDERWVKWNRSLLGALVETQDSAQKFAGQCKEGSWEPVDRWSCEGGRVYTTSMGVLTLEAYCRCAKYRADK